MRVSRYKTLVDGFAQQIHGGQLPAGTRLPTHRELAARHRIALATASRVYAELEHAGLVTGETGRGTFVRDIANPPGYGHTQKPFESGGLDLAFNYPTTPGHADMLRAALRELSSSGELGSLMAAQPAVGRATERRFVADYLHTKGIQAGVDDIVLVAGAQQGLATTVMSLLRPGDVVAVDELTYPGFLALGKLHKLDMHALRWNSRGPDMDALEQLLRKRPVKAIFCMPTLHNPSGLVMELEVRKRMIELARHHDVWIIEDGSYAFLIENPPPPIVTLAAERTVYVSGLSKILGGGIRFGFIVTPPGLQAKFEKTLRAMVWSNATLISALAGRWLDDGTVHRLEADKRREARRRHKLAIKKLAGLELVANENSFFVWVKLPESVRAEQLAISLSQKGIHVATSEAFAASDVYPHAVRLSLGIESMETVGNALDVIRREIELASCL
ncbi:MAG: PLP-dependent aminotransferase family protein [Sulfuritalea sp.]|nr:PLP-dependent aminotransferase family protein [Sulfuritalea sp.]